MLVEYVSSSVDGYGRVYARQVGAQLLPRDVRAMIYGKTHKEVDMTGAHYEILRRLSLSDTLPQVSVRIINAGVKIPSIVLVKLAWPSHLDDAVVQLVRRWLSSAFADRLAGWIESSWYTDKP